MNDLSYKELVYSRYLIYLCVMELREIIDTTRDELVTVNDDDRKIIEDYLSDMESKVQDIEHANNEVKELIEDLRKSNSMCDAVDDAFIAVQKIEKIVY